MNMPVGDFVGSSVGVEWKLARKPQIALRIFFLYPATHQVRSGCVRRENSNNFTDTKLKPKLVFAIKPLATFC